MRKTPDPEKAKPIATLAQPLDEVADAIYLHIRRVVHYPVHVYVKDGNVYALCSVYRISSVWDFTYPQTFVGCFTRMHRPYQIARLLAQRLGNVARQDADAA
jgi:hypothetical protein